MIALISNAVTLYLAPVLFLTAIFLCLFSYLSPVVMLHSQVSLLAVRPSLALSPNNTGNIDGPTVLLGVLGPLNKIQAFIAILIHLICIGSCAKSHNSGAFSCTPASLNPSYSRSFFWSRVSIPADFGILDLTVLPKNAPNLLSAPAATTPAFLALSLSFSVMFFILFTMIAFRARLGGRISGMLEKPLLEKVSAWIGFMGFMIGQSFL
jgi:hypothetical protein